MNYRCLIGIYGGETMLAVQEWGIKNSLRLFGIILSPMNEDEAEYMQEYAKAYFIDPGYKNMTFIEFDLKVTSGRVSISKTKRRPGFKYPIKFARTREFESKYIYPVDPLYQVLIDRKIILPFQSQMKNKEWAALPFENNGNMKPTEI